MRLKTRTPGHRGFTLVEVALAVAVGLTVIGGAVVAYNALRLQAGDSAARTRVAFAQTAIEESAAASMGVYPVGTSGGTVFATLWRAKRPDDYGISPWGGPTRNASGAIQRGTVVGGTTAAAAVSLGTTTSGFVAGTAQPLQYGMLLYNGVQSSTWGSASHPGEAGPVTVKNYGISIFDNAGIPYFALRGGH